MSRRATTIFGQLPDGSAVTAYMIGSPGGLELRVLDLGATVQSLRVPSGDGSVDVVLGHDDLAGYLAPRAGDHGAVVGRFANRIAGSRFTLDGRIHTRTANEGPTCLHGGLDGFHLRRWTLVDHTEDEVSFELVSPDGDQGFPGELRARAGYAVRGSDVDLASTHSRVCLPVLTQGRPTTLAVSDSS